MKKKIIIGMLAGLFMFGSFSAVHAMEVQEFPNPGDMYGMLDLSDPYRTVISGLFQQDIVDEEKGIKRECYVYISADNHQVEANITLIPDSGTDPQTFLEKSGWKDIADEQGLILLIAVPEEGGWDVDKDLDYLNAMYDAKLQRTWYCPQKHNGYLAAYGDGASLGQMWAIQDPQKLASFATFGNFEVDNSYIEEAAIQETNVEGITVGDIPMPVWFFVDELTENEQNVLEYWNQSNNVGNEILSSSSATAIYISEKATTDPNINEDKYLAETRYTVAENTSDYSDVERNREVWEFLSSIVRPVGYANNELHANRTLDEWGVTKHTTEVDGVTRYWLEYVPDRLHETEDGKVPLVVQFHGANQLAETFLLFNESIQLAKDRGFILISMTGSLTNTDEQMPRTGWNLEKEPNKFDDFSYVRAAVEDVVSRLPIDESRIYAMGQSYGAMATQTFAMDMSDIFAAAAPCSGFVSVTVSEENLNKLVTDFPEGRVMPLFSIMGEEELWDASIDSDYTQNELPYWLKINGLGDSVNECLDGFYKTGVYNIWSFSNENGIPLVQYAVGDERVHTICIEDMYLQYDSFLSKWSRGEDGTSYYMGQPVTK